MNVKILLDKIKFRNSIDVGTTEWHKKIMGDINNKNNCRCGHIQVWHFNSEEYCGGIATGFKPLEEDMCKCKHYIPSGNLNYLEYLYNKKVKHDKTRKI